MINKPFLKCIPSGGSRGSPGSGTNLAQYKGYETQLIVGRAYSGAAYGGY